jgi:hypothetical protein
MAFCGRTDIGQVDRGILLPGTWEHLVPRG